MNREELLAAKPPRVKSLDVAGIGSISLRVLSGREALELEVQLRGERDTPEKLAQLVAVQLAAFICDEEGKTILSQADAAQLVDQWSAGQVQQVIRAGARMNALGDEAVGAAGGN